jgi:ATP-dependent RNA helicase SUPV3L1/SUV3
MLVASDAVGMGLNLHHIYCEFMGRRNIRRVVFDRLEKYDGTTLRRLSDSQIRQIGGRAGRFQTLFEKGLVTTLYEEDHDGLVRAMQGKHTVLTKIGLQPSLDTMERFAHQLPTCSYSQVLVAFNDLCQLDEGYFLCSMDPQIVFEGGFLHVCRKWPRPSTICRSRWWIVFISPMRPYNCGIHSSWTLPRT